MPHTLIHLILMAVWYMLHVVFTGTEVSEPTQSMNIWNDIWSRDASHQYKTSTVHEVRFQTRL